MKKSKNIKTKNRIRIGLIISVLAVFLMLIAFLAVNAYFYSKQIFHFGPGITTINHVEVTGMDLSEAYHALTDSDNSDSVILQENKTYEIPVKNFAAFEYNQKDLEKTFSQYGNFLQYLFSFSKSFTLKKEVTLDKEQALETLKDVLEQTERSDNTDAAIEKQEDTYALIEEKQGNTIDYDALIEKLYECLADGKNTIDLTQCYTKPAHTAEMLSKDYEELMNLLEWKITYASPKGDHFTIDRSAFFDYISFSTAQGIKINFGFLDNALKQLKEQFDTVGSTREFTNFYGETLQVSGGTYGYSINAEKEKEVLIALMYKCESQENRTPEYLRKEVSSERGGIGNTYIEVSIPNQHLWYYVDGALVTESDIVTGMKNKHDTPTGIYYITEKKNGKYLTGADYRTWVNKWMRLTNTGIGLHDATWKSRFGSNLYETKGSHGCINLPYDFACSLYDMVDIGVPVVIY